MDVYSGRYGSKKFLEGASAFEGHSWRLSVLRLEECPSPITHQPASQGAGACHSEMARRSHALMAAPLEPLYTTATSRRRRQAKSIASATGENRTTGARKTYRSTRIPDRMERD